MGIKKNNKNVHLREWICRLPGCPKYTTPGCFNQCSLSGLYCLVDSFSNNDFSQRTFENGYLCQNN
ncbi:hypothetical protein Hanom_Chr10g00903391 [Helianthus anomalus]